jgi:hypothetical protein
MLKYILVGVLISLLFGGGAARLKALLSTSKRLKDDFDDGKARAQDPVGHARPVEGQVRNRDM